MSEESEFYVGINNPKLISQKLQRFENLEESFHQEVSDLKQVRKEIDLMKVDFLDDLLVLVKEFVDFKKVLPKVSDKKLEKKSRVMEKRQKYKKSPQKKVSKEQEVKNRKRRTEQEIEKVKSRNKRVKLDRLKSYRKELEELGDIIKDL